MNVNTCRYSLSLYVYLYMVTENPYLGDDILEVALPPGLGGMGHHGQGRVVILLILVIQEHQLGPQVRLLSCPQYLITKYKTSVFSYSYNS